MSPKKGGCSICSMAESGEFFTHPVLAVKICKGIPLVIDVYIDVFLMLRTFQDAILTGQAGLVGVHLVFGSNIHFEIVVSVLMIPKDSYTWKHIVVSPKGTSSPKWKWLFQVAAACFSERSGPQGFKLTGQWRFEVLELTTSSVLAWEHWCDKIGFCAAIVGLVGRYDRNLSKLACAVFVKKVAPVARSRHQNLLHKRMHDNAWCKSRQTNI